MASSTVPLTAAPALHPRRDPSRASSPSPLQPREKSLPPACRTPTSDRVHPAAPTAQAAAELEAGQGHVSLGPGAAHGEASLQARALVHLRGLGLVACGIGAVVGLSWGMAACGATAGLLQVLSGASVLDRVAGSVPFIGPLLAVLMGVGGNYGFANVGLIVFHVVDACFVQRRQAGNVVAWLRAHAAMAGALSPLWLAGATPLTAPVLLGVAAGVGYLSWSIQRAQHEATPPKFNHALFALGVSLALAPIGAQAAAGTASIRVARQAVNFPLLAFGCIAIVSALRQLWALFGGGSAGTQGGTPMRPEGATVFDGRNEADATVFVPQNVVYAVQDLVARVRHDVAHNQNDGPRCYMLRAPRGTGKHALACGVAHALNTRIYKLERAAFEALGKAHSGRALAQQMQQWGEEAEELGRPLIVFVPELTKLAPNAEKDDFVSQLKTLLANEGGGTARNLLFLLATSEPAAKARSHIDGAILNRVTGTWRWGTLAQSEVARLLEVKLRAHLLASSIHREVSAPLLDGGLRACCQTVLNARRMQRVMHRGCTGSHVDAWATEAVDSTVSAYLRQRQPDLGPDEPSENFPLAERLTRKLAGAIDARLDEPGPEDGPVRPSGEAPPEPVPTAEADGGAERDGVAETERASQGAGAQVEDELDATPSTPTSTAPPTAHGSPAASPQAQEG